MSGPRIADSTPGKRPSLPRLPHKAERLLPYTREQLTEPGSAAALGSPFAPEPDYRALLVGLISILALALAATALALALRGGGHEEPPLLNGSQPVASRPLQPVVLGREGSGIINCAFDTVMVFLPGESTPTGAAVASLEGASGSLLVPMRATAGGYRAYLDVHDGTLRVRGRHPPQRLALRPGEELIMRMDGVLGARILEVKGERQFPGRVGDETCLRAAEPPR